MSFFKKTLVAIIILIPFASVTLYCGRTLTRKETIDAAAECTRAGMKARLVYNMWTGNLVDVECVPLNPERYRD